MRVRKLARWAAGLVAIAAFGVAAVLGVTAANADEATDPPAEDPTATTFHDTWD